MTDNIIYNGEHIWLAEFGYLFSIISFSATLFSFIASILYIKNRQIGWFNASYRFYLVHSIAVFFVVGLLFFILTNRYFEFYYVWKHTNLIMPSYYIFSSFWEGQEGSFLIWSFWNVLTSLILLYKIKQRRWKVLNILTFSLVQLFLSSMTLGIVFENFSIGSSPFLFLRHHSQMQNLPFVSNANYLDLIDGNGLNPLLQNYWMLIHPPTLFLGFALVLLVFSSSMAAIIEHNFIRNQNLNIKISFIAVGILGIGILMGGAWAYESLSFGGFWAWDPVENAVLIPWLLLLVAAHNLIVAKTKANFYKFSVLFSGLAFLAVLYATFLTRSGVLGETSVHAFTDLEINWQLVSFLLFIIFYFFIFYFRNYKSFIINKEQEQILSREFIVFLGSLVLFLSAFQIAFSTSIPLINKIFNTKMAPPIDVYSFYHSWQIPFAILVLLLTAVSHYFIYNKTANSKVFKLLIIHFGIAVLFTIIISYYTYESNPILILLIFSSLFSFISNFFYIYILIKNKSKKLAGLIAHTGFALIILGTIISNGNKKIISINTSGTDVSKLGKNFSNLENILLRQNDTVRMSDYYITYTGRFVEGQNVNFKVDFLKKNENKFEKEFSLYPIIQINKKMGNVADPSIKRFFNKDIFTHLTFADINSIENIDEPKISENIIKTKIGDTLFFSKSFLIIEKLNVINNEASKDLKKVNLKVQAVIKAYTLEDSFLIHPIFEINGNKLISTPDSVPNAGLYVFFDNINPKNEELEFKIYEEKNDLDFIVMKAMIFPYINVLWTGCIIMFIGCIMVINNKNK